LLWSRGKYDTVTVADGRATVSTREVWRPPAVKRQMTRKTAKGLSLSQT